MYVYLSIYIATSLPLPLSPFDPNTLPNFVRVCLCACVRVFCGVRVRVRVWVINQDDEEEEEEAESEEARNTREDLEWDEMMQFGKPVMLPIVRQGTHGSVCVCPHVCLLTDVDVFACVCMCVCSLFLPRLLSLAKNAFTHIDMQLMSTRSNAH